MSIPMLLVVLFDGLSHDSFHSYYHNYGNLTKFYENSPKVERGIRPAFPTITAPNLMTIATGLYPESHGIIANNMYNESSGANFILESATDEQSLWWDNNFNLPIWTLNEMTGSPKRSSGAMYWFGAGSSYKHRNIKYYKKYDVRGMSWFEEVDKVVGWMKNANNPANCVFLYFDQPDIILHEEGTHPKLISKLLKKIDATMGYLLSKVKKTGLKDSLNIIVTSDHGHMNVPPDNYNEISTLNISQDHYRHFGDTAMWNIYPTPGNFDAVYDAFEQGSKSQNFSIWKKDDFPETAHYKRSDRVGPIILVSDPGFKTVLEKFDNITSMRGSHGYNNSCSAMRSFFMANGPSFDGDANLKEFNNVDLYPLMCHLLGLNPGPNNGSFDKISAMLKEPLQKHDSLKNEPLNYPALIVGTSLVVLVITAFIFFARRIFDKSAKNNHKYNLVNNSSSLAGDLDSDD